MSGEITDKRAIRMKTIQAENIEKVRVWDELNGRTTIKACKAGTKLSYPTIKKARDLLAATQGEK